MMDKPVRKAEYRFQQGLGDFISTCEKKALPGFRPPVYFNSMANDRTGNTVILHADVDYYKLFPDNADQTFIHHMHEPCLYLTEKLPPAP